MGTEEDAWLRAELVSPSCDFSTPEVLVKAFEEAVLKRNLQAKALHASGRWPDFDGPEFMSGMAEGETIEALFWGEPRTWVGASSFGWSSEDEWWQRFDRVLSVERLSDSDTEVHAEWREKDGRLLKHEVYRTVKRDGRWWLRESFELAVTPAETSSGPAVKPAPMKRTFRTVPRPALPVELPRWSWDHRLSAWRLHAYRDESVTAQDSHLAGPFLENSPADWPKCEEHRTPLAAVLQLWKRDLPNQVVADADDLFAGQVFDLPKWAATDFPPGKDVLQLLWCPHDHYDGFHSRLRWLNSAVASDTGEANPRCRVPAHAGTIPHVCRLVPEWITDYPDAEVVRQSEAWKEIVAHPRLRAATGVDPEESNESWYSEHMGSAPGIKLGGHCRWIQPPPTTPVMCECGTAMVHFLTMDSSYDQFSGAWAVRYSPSADPPPDMGTGLLLGDVGSVNIFACPACPGKTVVQSIQQC